MSGDQIYNLLKLTLILGFCALILYGLYRMSKD